GEVDASDLGDAREPGGNDLGSPRAAHPLAAEAKAAEPAGRELSRRSVCPSPPTTAAPRIMRSSMLPSRCRTELHRRAIVRKWGRSGHLLHFRAGSSTDRRKRGPAFRLPAFERWPIMTRPDPPGRSTPMLSTNISPDVQREMLRQMLTIRRFEERASADYLAGKIYGVVHCYIGEEAVAVGVCSALGQGDRIISTHRGHGHCIAKGADLNRMMAELYGRQTGYCKGKGGSMHIADLGIGMVGGSGLVAG